MKKEERLKELNRMQIEVTQNEGTEPPFKNEFWDNEEVGVYVDIVSFEPLFLSTDKFDAGCGWPSFSRPLEGSSIYEKSDFKMARERIEVRTKNAETHLGHVFDDGPLPTKLRYCINSASLKFIPYKELENFDLGHLKKYFDTKE